MHRNTTIKTCVCLRLKHSFFYGFNHNHNLSSSVNKSRRYQIEQILLAVTALLRAGNQAHQRNRRSYESTDSKTCRKETKCT
jgi:hypothetical protein